MARSILTRSSRGVRGPKTPAPTGIALQLQRVMREMVRECMRRVLAYLDLAQRADAASFISGQRNRRVALIIEDTISARTIATHIATAADRTGRHARLDPRSLPGISYRHHPNVAPKLAAFRERNVALIRDLADRTRERVTKTLDDADVSGLRVEDLSKRLQEDFEFSSSRAELIARDQVLKLNAQITQSEQTAAGINRYQWSSSRDERVRPIHDELDGTIQSWDDPPITSVNGDRNHPGEDYQCRCVAIPIID